MMAMLMRAATGMSWKNSIEPKVETKEGSMAPLTADKSNTFVGWQTVVETMVVLPVVQT